MAVCFVIANAFLYSFLLPILDRQESVLRSVRQTKVETELFKGGHAYLHRTGHYQLVIFKGSGYGCSFAAKMLFERAVNRRKKEMNAYCLKSADEACSIGHNEKAILLVLDANGATGSDIRRLDGWFEFLKERVPIGASSNTNLTIIMTLQDFTDEQKRVHPIQRRYKEYIVDASEKKYRPSKQTKEKLFEAVLQQKNVRVNPIRGGSPISRPGAGKMTFLDKDTADGIVPLLGSVRFIGKLADYFQSDFTDGLNSLRTPRPEIVHRIRDSHREGGTLFLTLLAVLAHGCQLGVGRINQMRKQNEHAEKFWYSADNINKKSKRKTKKIQSLDNVHLQNLYRFAEENGHLMNLGENLQKYAYHLDGEFLAEKNDVYRFCDGRVYYSFLLVYCEKYSNALDDCEDNFFYNFVKSSGISSEEEKDVFLLVNDGNLTIQTRAVMKRFRKEMMLRHVAKCMKHPMMTTSFFQLFLKYLQETKHWLWLVLTQQDCDPREPYSCLYHGAEPHNDTFKGEPRNKTEVIILHDIWKKKRRKPKWKMWMKPQESETLIRLAEMSNCKTFKLLVAKGADIPIGALKKAIEVKNEDIIDFILQKGNFSPEEWYQEATHAAILISQETLSPTLLPCLKSLILKTDFSIDTRDRPPLLHFAVQTKKAKLLKKLLDGDFTNSQIDVNSTYNDETPLTAAIRSGSRDIVEILLEKNADLSHSDVIFASSQGNADLLKLLLHRDPKHMFIEDSDGLIPLFYAVSFGHTEAVQVILSNVIDQNNQSEKTTTNEQDPTQVWHLPCRNNDEHNLAMLRQKRNHDGQTALHVAAERGHKTIVLLLLLRGFDIEVKDFRSETPLSLACNGKHKQTVRLILSKCKKPDEKVLMRAVQNKDIELLQMLIEYNYDINVVNRDYGAPLLIAIQHRMHEVIGFLLSNGADTEIQQNGHRPIHLAAAKGDVESLQMLMQSGANICATTEKKNETIIHIAAEKEQLYFIATVLQTAQGSCLIDKKNSDGETALHLASKVGSSDLISLLLRHGFSSKLPNRNGQIPVTLVTKALLEAIASRDKSKWNALADCEKILQMS